MPRARLLKPGFFANQELAALPMAARLLFAGLWTLADRDGRLKDIPKWIDAQIFPYEEVETDSLLDQLQAAGFIRRYMKGGQDLIWIPSWQRHQRPHPNEPASTLPRHAHDKVMRVVNQSTDNDQPMSRVAHTNVTSLQLQSHEPGPPMSTATQAVASPSSPSSPSIPSKAESIADNSNGVLSSRMPFSKAEVTNLLENFPNVNVNSRWKSYVEWIEGGGGERPRNVYSAFVGFLKQTPGLKTTRAAAAAMKGQGG